MANTWLEIPNPDIDQEHIAQQVQSRFEKKMTQSTITTSRPEELAANLWQQILGDKQADPSDSSQIGLQLRDCDIVPRTYEIGWQTPILGPIFAYVRRIINGEIRRFLAPSLERQSALNRQLLRLIQNLQAENQRLHQELDNLKREKQ